MKQGSFTFRVYNLAQTFRGLPGAATAVRCNASLRTPKRTSSPGQHRSRRRFETQRNAVVKLAHVAVCRDAADIPSIKLLRVVVPAAKECFAWAAAGGRGLSIGVVTLELEPPEAG